MSKKIQFSIALTQDIYDELNTKCDESGLSKSGYITYSLKQMFQAEELKKQLPDLVQISAQIRDLQKALEEKEQ